ncbi:MAG: hypothetical protein JXJ19_03655 [Elusimicrobia bacterium]|nr:hypothetical protein [Elusimicrobiota bacterium]
MKETGDGLLDGNIRVLKKTGTANDRKQHLVIAADGGNIHLKIFNNTGIAAVLKDIFRASKARKFYASNFEIRKRGIPSPDALFILEKRMLFLKFSSIIATREIEESTPFTGHYKAWVGTRPEKDRLNYIEEIARFIFKLNSSGVCHADLLGNILVNAGGGRIRMYLIDNDAVKLFDNLTRFDYIKHFEGFYDYFVKKAAVSREDWETLCREYLKMDKSVSDSVEGITQHVANRKNLLYYLKNY